MWSDDWCQWLKMPVDDVYESFTSDKIEIVLAVWSGIGGQYVDVRLWNTQLIDITFL